MRRRRKGLERRLARERMEILFGQAEEAAVAGNLPRADRYAQLARKLGMRYNVSLPPSYRRLFCRRCQRFLAPGTTATFRFRRSRAIVTCRSCGTVYRYPHP